MTFSTIIFLPGLIVHEVKYYIVFITAVYKYKQLFLGIKKGTIKQRNLPTYLCDQDQITGLTESENIFAIVIHCSRLHFFKIQLLEKCIILLDSARRITITRIELGLGQALVFLSSTCIYFTTKRTRLFFNIFLNTHFSKLALSRGSMLN